MNCVWSNRKCPCSKKCPGCPGFKSKDLVCGKNGVTFSSPCEAKCQNAPIKCVGRCPCPISNPNCPTTFNLDPVCGTNGGTYDNDSEAACDKIDVACRGRCPCEGKAEYNIKYWSHISVYKPVWMWEANQPMVKLSAKKLPLVEIIIN